MVTFKPLCNRCQQISFDALRGPSTTDLKDLIDGQIAGRRFPQVVPGTESYKISLGSLSRIQNASSTCPLCTLFCSIIKRQGAVYLRNSVYETLDSGDIEFVADPDLSWYAKIGSPDTPSTGVFQCRRLSLTAHAESAPEFAIAYFDHLLQVCDVGSLSASDERAAMQAHRTVDGMPFGGRKRPLTLDLQLVHGWIQICTNEHGRHCLLNDTQDGSTQVDIFRLIDVHQRSIQEFREPRLAELEFMALSYVWGSKPSTRLLKANKCILQEPGAFGAFDIPQTISDSMDFVGQLGYQYLWVDAFCVIQDDADDQSYQIGKMGAIFSSAFLTIVAASGEDSGAGLPGLGSLSRPYEQHEVIVIPPSEDNDGLSVINTLKSTPRHFNPYYRRGQEDADFSKWSRRAWTMQEMALSRRTIVFTKEQVFWKCHQAYFCEESYFEIPKTRLKHFNPSVHKLSTQQLTETSSDPWELYEDLINNYMLRDLTYEGDVHAAFEGILDAMEQATKTEFHWGLPLSRFELALSWETLHGVDRRVAVSTLPMTSLKKQVSFPSWSWMGWAGDIHCRVGDTRRESENAVVICFIHRIQPLRLCHVSLKSDASATSVLWANDDIQRQKVSLQDVKQHLPNLSEDTLTQYAEGALLFFWAQSAHFKVLYDKTDRPANSFVEYSNQPRPIIQDESGKGIGFVCRTSTTGGGDRLEEFVAVGRRQILGIPEDMTEDICPPAILALQIARDEDGLASRINCAEISRKAWVRAEPKEVLVALR